MITALLPLITGRAHKARTAIALIVPALLVTLGAAAADQPLQIGPLELDLALAALAAIPAGSAIVLAVLVIGQDIGSGAVVHLLDTPVSRGRLCLHAILVTTTGTALLAVPALILLGLLRPDGPGRLGLGPLAALALIESLVYSALAVAAFILTRRDLLAAILVVVGWELIGSQILFEARIASVRWTALALIDGRALPSVVGPLPDQSGALIVLLTLFLVAWAAGTAALLWQPASRHRLGGGEP